MKTSEISGLHVLISPSSFILCLRRYSAGEKKVMENIGITSLDTKRFEIRLKDLLILRRHIRVKPDLGFLML